LTSLEAVLAIGISVTFTCSVSHVCALCSNGRKRQRNFVLKFGLHQSPLPPQILFKVIHLPVDLSGKDIRQQIVAEWLVIVQ